METLADILGLTKPLAYATATYGFFRWLDADFDEGANATLAGALRSISVDENRIGLALQEVFNRMYTPQLLSWAAFFRSALFTSIVMAAFLYEYGINQIRDIQTSDIWVFEGGDLLLMYVTNVLTDYLSLFALKRWLITSDTKPVARLIIGTCIAILVVYILILIRFYLLAAIEVTFQFDILKDVFRNTGYGWSLRSWTTERAIPALAVFAWLPLFAVGFLVIRALSPLSRLVAWFQRISKSSKDRPLRAVGLVAAVTVFVLASALQIL